MISWDAPCNKINCEHLYYAYGCEPNCAYYSICDRIKEYADARNELLRKERCGSCKNTHLCDLCSRNYRDLYAT